MSKTCSICNNKISFMSEYNLKKGSKQKICFECYEQLATALKGKQQSIDILRHKYKDNISKEVTQYIDAIEKDISTKPTNKLSNKDIFMDLAANTIKPEITPKANHKKSIVYIGNLSNEKVAKLKTVKIVSNLCFIALLLIVPISSFYVLQVIKSPLNAAITFVAGLFIIVLFYLIKVLANTILDESN